MSQPTTQEIANLTNLLIRLQSDYYTLKGEYSHLPSTHPLNIIYVSRGYAHGETIDRILTSLRQNPEQLRTLTTDYNTIRDTLMDLRRQLEAPPYSRRPGVEYLILREGEPDLVGQIPTFVRGFSGRTAASASATGIGSGSGSGSGSGPGSGARALRQVGGWYTVKAGKAGQAHPHADKIKISQSVGKYTPGITIGPAGPPMIVGEGGVDLQGGNDDQGSRDQFYRSLVSPSPENLSEEEEQNAGYGPRGDGKLESPEPENEEQ